METVTAYRIEVQTGPDEWLPVGHLYRDRETAKSWVGFVKKARHARRARVVKVELPERT